MKRVFFIFYFLFFIFQSKSQNIVPNYSFESHTQCPNSMSQLSYCNNWYSPTSGNPDYYNQCSPLNMGVPENIFGFQYAKTGLAYSGIYVFGASPPPAREYIQTQLTDSLQVGKHYCIEFYINLSNLSNTAITQIGAYLSNLPVSAANSLPLPYIPQIISPVGYYLSDSINWIQISGIYLAQGGEQYITIGNFKDEITTDTLHWSIFSAISYYYIDDVSVKCCDCDTSQPPNNNSNITIPNIFTPNNDGINDVFKITSKNITSLNCKIYNRWGILLGELTKINEMWDGNTTSGLQCASGVYYYVLTAIGEDGKEYEEKGFVSLVR